MRTFAGVLLVSMIACSTPPEPEPPPPPPVVTPGPVTDAATWDVEAIAADVKLQGIDAVEMGGAVHVAFGAVRDGEEHTLWWQRDGKGTTRVQDIVDRASLWEVAMDDRARLHLLYGAPRAYAVAGSPETRLVRPIQHGDAGDEAGGLAVDASGTPHLCFVANVGGARKLVHATWRGSATGAGDWQTEELSAKPGNCQLAFGPDGTLHLVSAGDGVQYGVRRGPSWVFESIDPGPGSHGPSLALTTQGEPVVTWVSGDRARFAQRTGGTWDRDELSDQVIGWDAPLSLDESDHPHVAFHRRRQVLDESGKPLLDASTVVYTHHDGARWLTQDVGDSRSQALALTLAGGRAHLFHFDPLRDWLLHAERRGPQDCEPGRQRRGSACCWPGQQAGGGSCTGRPACPEGFVRDAASGCKALPRAIAFGARSCKQVRINGTVDLGAEKACRLAAADELGPRYFRERCDAGHADDCYVLGALSDHLVTQQSAYALMPLCKTICRHARRSWKGNPIRLGQEDPAKALQAYRRACELGHRDACVRVADLGDRDDERRNILVSLCTKDRRQPMCSRAVNEAPEIDAIASVATTLASLCKEGNGAACGDLGVLTENGEGVKADLDGALELYAKGCETGHLPSCRSVAYAAANHPERRAAMAVAGKTAFTHLKAACDDGNEPDCHALAVQYDLGFGAARDRKRAEALYEKVCTDRRSRLCDRP